MASLLEMEPDQYLGWLSSLVLLVTILQQIYTQWKKGSSEGVSWFLFTGQLIASAGFVTYSYLTGDMVFIVTNGLLFCSHILGLFITWRQKTAASSEAQP